MICGEGVVTIARSSEDILEFVLDLERYAQADTKIRRIRRVERHGTVGRVRHGGQLRGLPGPPVDLSFELEPYDRLVFRSERRGLGWLVFRFEGTFTCQPVAGGTRLVHRECFTFRRPLRWFLEPYARAWLAEDTAAEVGRMKAILEAG